MLGTLYAERPKEKREKCFLAKKMGKRAGRKINE
jgi:hypothetical protein